MHLLINLMNYCRLSYLYINTAGLLEDIDDVINACCVLLIENSVMVFQLNNITFFILCIFCTIEHFLILILNF